MEQYTPPAGSPNRVFKRVSKACRRCRRLRTKCVNQGGVPPCEPCRQANTECVFPARGEPDTDRAHRHARSRTDRSRSIGMSNPATSPQPSNQGRSDSISTQEPGLPLNGGLLSNPMEMPLTGPSSPAPGWETLPPFNEVVEGIQSLTTSFFQLGFLPKMLFFEGLKKDRNSVSFFLLFGILSVSARFTPSLVKRYQGGANATKVFLRRASHYVQEQMFASTLDSIQAFFLMSIAEWGNGDKNRSLVYMGIAIRLAGILRLHREETYRLPTLATNEEIVYSEVARRTFWMLETFENLHSGSDSPIAFSYNDITVLLPCDEREFTFGIRPTERAALMGTPPATYNPALTRLPSRSLFATLLQTHSLWGRVARRVGADAMQLGSAVESGISPDNYDNLSQALVDFERDLPPQHSWSVWNLRAFKVEGLDLAYLSAVMVLRLSNIILRRSYLHDILNTQRRTIPAPNHMAGLPTRTDAWSAVADQLFDNMLTLHEQITAFFEYRSPEQGYPALIVFCVYVCGSLAKHLHRQPHICPRVAVRAVDILQNSIGGLVNLQAAWPFARRWYLALCRATEDVSMEPNLSTPTHQDLDPTSTGLADQQHLASHAPPTFEVQFNDPLPSDTIFGAFDMYLWNGVIDGCSPFDEPIPASGTDH
ncbi:hypothetical protein F4821DRAFT_192143 [Hypoxylon rubiginosum]|uniref:Uncharacterized protein n=1 Tax=Hypoxylon rubiginosum TaxID=110542 RepID=A0ACC0CSX1_9PEZI|nr:hypothetical protein F4821DRAFT_192143 [Hypoxylon rubiginosum]